MRSVSQRFVGQWPLRPRTLTLVVLLGCLLSSTRPAEAQKPVVTQQVPAVGLETARQEWFFNQRRYGLGYIPDDALAKAVAQRDGIRVGKASVVNLAATDTAP